MASYVEEMTKMCAHKMLLLLFITAEEKRKILWKKDNHCRRRERNIIEREREKDIMEEEQPQAKERDTAEEIYY